MQAHNAELLFELLSCGWDEHRCLTLCPSFPQHWAEYAPYSPALVGRGVSAFEGLPVTGKCHQPFPLLRRWQTVSWRHHTTLTRYGRGQTSR